MTGSAIVLFAHGSRDPEWARPFENIQRMVAIQQPGIPVELCFLEIMQPSLPEAIRKLVATGVNRIRVVPLFLAQGGHLKHDLTRLIDELRLEHPRHTIEVSQALGESKAMQEKIADWVCEQNKPSV